MVETDTRGPLGRSIAVGDNIYTGTLPYSLQFMFNKNRRPNTVLQVLDLFRMTKQQFVFILRLSTLCSSFSGIGWSICLLSNLRGLQTTGSRRAGVQ